MAELQREFYLHFKRDYLREDDRLFSMVQVSMVQEFMRMSPVFRIDQSRRRLRD